MGGGRRYKNTCTFFRLRARVVRDAQTQIGNWPRKRLQKFLPCEHIIKPQSSMLYGYRSHFHPPPTSAMHLFYYDILCPSACQPPISNNNNSALKLDHLKIYFGHNNSISSKMILQITVSILVSKDICRVLTRVNLGRCLYLRQSYASGQHWPGGGGLGLQFSSFPVNSEVHS